jgi:hypothetical protein
VPVRKKAPPAPPKLTDGDVEALRARVKAGENPRVVVRVASAAVPAGTRGSILRIGKPSEGEYIVVRLGKDEVPFAPSELAMSGRQPAASKAAAAAPPAKKATPATKTATKQTAKPAAAPIARKAPTKPSPPAKAARPRKTTRRAAGGRTPPPLVVTLRFNDGVWSVEAARGARRLAKPSGVRPGAVKAFADLLDEETVREALSETIESCRSVVEERAAALRAELVAAEAALKEYEARRR